MDWTWKAAATAAAVALVLLGARVLGQRVAGLMAGLPLITAPALLWVGAEQGTHFAAEAALGSVVACALVPWFGLVFERLVRPHGPLRALSAGFAVLVLGAWAVLGALPRGDHGLSALLLAALACAALGRRLGRSPRGRVAPGLRPLRGEPWLTAAVAGLVSVAVAALAPRLGAGWAGVMASLPLISASALVHLHRAGTPEDVRRFLRGWGQGIWGKALFGCAFALAAPAAGIGPALLLGALAGAAGIAGAAGLRARWGV